MLDIDESLFDIDIRRTVFTHRAEFDQMTLGSMLLDGE